MPYTKLQSGDWLAAGTCTEPEYRLVGKRSNTTLSLWDSGGPVR